MNIRIFPSALSGRVNAPFSKSDAHRTLIAAALSSGSSIIDFSCASLDVTATVNCLCALGARLTGIKEMRYRLDPIGENPVRGATLDCGESGSTLRFLIPVSAALGAEAAFTGHGRLPERPISQLLEALREHGCGFSAEKLPLTVSGRLAGGVFQLPGNISSQYVSGLLFALPLAEADSKIVLSSSLESAAYVDMTLATLQKFGVQVEPTADGFLIPGGQHYTSPGTVCVEGDWSNAAFFLAAGAIGKQVTCKGLSLDSPQGDKAILELLQRFGAGVHAHEKVVTVSPGRLTGCEIDVSGIPDLLPVLAVVGAVSEGATALINAARLRIKESDRLNTVTKMLRALGAELDEREDALIIHGKPGLNGGTTDSFGDHRIAMAASVASIACENTVAIQNAQAVDKSYPSFFDDFNALGGNIDVV